MNNRDDDRDLRETFASLRREEKAKVTAFHKLVTPRHRVSLAPAGVFVTVLVVIGLAIGWVLQPSGRDPPRSEMSLAAWSGPTAFLLHTPGHDLLSSVPAFGRALPSADLNEKGVHRHE